MLLKRYLRAENLELLKKEVAFSTCISLKTIPCWLINKDCLKEQQNKSNKWGLAIVITISNEIKAKRLIANSP